MPKFTKAQRLLNKAQFQHVFSNAKKIEGKELFFLVRKNTLSYPRLGLAISKKSVNKAHDRNRIKRIIRESFRTSPLPSYDVIALARKGLDELSNESIHAKLQRIWQRLNGLK